jgi:short-chain fatty acids transporter
VQVVVKFTLFLRKVLPSPFTIAVLLTYVTFVLALLFTPNNSDKPHFELLTGYWLTGFFELLGFTMQMMLILVLGYVLALTKPVNNLINKFSSRINSTASAAYIVTFLVIIFSYINWGLGLIFGAVFARKIAENFSRRDIKFNYPLIGAAGYTGLLVWHGGLSGSAPLKVAESGHFLESKIGTIPLTETLFSFSNIIMAMVFLIVLPLIMRLLSRKEEEKLYRVESTTFDKSEKSKAVTGADKLDYSRWFSLSLAFLFVITIFFVLIESNDLGFLNLNFINFSLFALGVMLTPNIHTFVSYITKSISAASGILIQFPLYAGIMGLMKYSGLFLVFTDIFVNVSNASTLPFLTFISAGVVNFFVPSGGGQWAVQGPVITEAAQQLGVPVSKVIMALAYGDEWTNMLQPFWALPLLGITGLKAKDIVPYTFVLFVAGGIIFTLFLFL